MHYDRIAAAIRYLREEAPRQPPLAEVAAYVHLSPAHFQRIFTAWAGVSPKQFARTLTVAYAKRLLDREDSPSLFDVAQASCLSSTSRLHDAFVRLEAMTPGEYRSGGASLSITHAYAKTRFGQTLIARTPRGICHLSFGEDRAAMLAMLQDRYPGAQHNEGQLEEDQSQALALIDGAAADPARPLAVHVGGTPFQFQVWRALLDIAPGRIETYGSLGGRLGRPRAAQAIGNAVGANRIAWLIPCHRVLRGDGKLGGYAWGEDRKAAMLGLEWSADEG